MNEQPSLVDDENEFEIDSAAGCGAACMTLSECLERAILVSPDSQRPLRRAPGPNERLTDGIHEYEVSAGSPLLYPLRVSVGWVNGALPLAYAADSFQQYVLISQIKQRGEINAALGSSAVRKHHYRLRVLCAELSGLLLDVGSDSPSISSSLFPKQCRYLGIDPYAPGGEFRLIGLGEILPVADQSMDCVIFNTSLDHMLDYMTAIDEAIRVLKPGGRLVIATYSWVTRATLLTDSVHFHHFREYQILGALAGRLRIDEVARYRDPKGDDHRFGLYVRASRSPGLR